ncbi:MAG: hypothetical protein WCT77_08610, partial [Bacteroidota bacterium]
LEAKKFNPDGVVVIGSDDILSEDIFTEIYAKTNEKSIGFLDAYIYSSLTKELYYFSGYNKSHFRYKEPCGGGRYFSKKLLNKVDWSLWHSLVDKDSSLDYLCISNLNAINVKIKGIELKNMFMVDIKSEQNITPFTSFNNPESIVPYGKKHKFIERILNNETMKKTETKKVTTAKAVKAVEVKNELKKSVKKAPVKKVVNKVAEKPENVKIRRIEEVHGKLVEKTSITKAGITTETEKTIQLGQPISQGTSPKPCLKIIWRVLNIEHAQKAINSLKAQTDGRVNVLFATNDRKTKVFLESFSKDIVYKETNIPNELFNLALESKKQYCDKIWLLDSGMELGGQNTISIINSNMSLKNAHYPILFKGNKMNESACCFIFNNKTEIKYGAMYGSGTVVFNKLNELPHDKFNDVIAK